MQTTAIEATNAETVATVVEAMHRALTGEVTEPDLKVLNLAMQQVQIRIDAQHGSLGRVTYDLADDHPGGGRAVRVVHTELPAGIGMELAQLSEDTGKDLGFLHAAAVMVLCMFVDQLRAGKHVYAENPATGRRDPLKIDWA